APADTAAGRQLQMRALARRFTGYLAEPGEADDKLTELRLMAKPLHQYEATDGSGREGAVFALVTTTDPEIVLLIESRKAKGGVSARATATRADKPPVAPWPPGQAGPFGFVATAS